MTPTWPDRLFIDNEWCAPASGKWMPVVDPASEEEIGRVPRADTNDVDRAVRSAARAFEDGWGRTAPEERGALLNRIADLIDAGRTRSPLPRPATWASRYANPTATSRARRAPSVSTPARSTSSRARRRRSATTASLHPARTARRHRAHHALELSLRQRLPLGAARARGRLHRRGEAGLADQRDDADARRYLPRGGSAGGCRERRDRQRRRNRRGAGAASARPGHRLHRLDRHRRRIMGYAAEGISRSCSNWAARTPRSCLPTAIWTRRSPRRCAARSPMPARSARPCPRPGRAAPARRLCRSAGREDRGTHGRARAGQSRSWAVGQRRSSGENRWLYRRRRAGRRAPADRRPAARGAGQGYFIRPALFDRVEPSSTLGAEEIFGPVLAVIPFDTEPEAVAIATASNSG